MHTCSTWSVDVRLVYLPIIFYQLFPLFRLAFFPGLNRIRIDTLWAQLFLVFFYSETMHTCTCCTWSEDVHVVFG